MKTKIVALAALVLLGLVSSGYATPVVIANYSFEANSLGWVGAEGEARIENLDYPGWVESNPSVAGAYNPSDIGFFPNDPTTGLVNAPDGLLVAYLNGEGSSITQNLDWYSIRYGATLTLQLDLGWWNGISRPTFEVGLVSNGEWLASMADNSGLTPGAFSTFTLTYDVTDVALEGRDLSIVIANTGGGLLFVDNVRLENDGPTRPVPEPGTLLLMGIGMFSLGLAKRAKRQNKQ